MKKTSTIVIIVIAIIILCCWSAFALTWTQGMMDREINLSSNEGSIS